MMSYDKNNLDVQAEDSPFRSENTPVANVSGIPENYTMIDLSTHNNRESSEESASAEPTSVSSTISETASDASEATVEIVGIRFKKGGKIYYFDPHGIKGSKGDFAIVQTARGLEYGEIALGNTSVPQSEIVPPIRPLVRIATDADKEHNEDNRKKEDEAFRICLEKIASHKLDMKLVEAQYTFDNSKLLFYFTSSGRVDFRDLVKDLASVFRTRIELRQIGIRDEAKLIGGLGSCGRALCCSGFLSDFGQVSIKMAKEQNLSLNSTKISGTCGRLMCCLRYEYETYLEEIRLTPPVNSLVKTPDGVGTVTETSPLTGIIKVRLNLEPDTAPRPYHRDTVTVFPKGVVPTEEDLQIRVRKNDDFAERLAAFENALSSKESPSRRTGGDSSARREQRNDTRSRDKRDDRRSSPQAQKKPIGISDQATPTHESATTGKDKQMQTQGKGRSHGHNRRSHHGHRSHRHSGNKPNGEKGNS